MAEHPAKMRQRRIPRACRPRPLCRRSAGAGRHLARPCHPLAACARRHRCDRCEHRRWRTTASGRSSPAKRCASYRSRFSRGENAGAAVGTCGRASALCRRAGGAGRRREPLYRRRRCRAGEYRIRAARSDHRSVRRMRKNRRRSSIRRPRPTKSRCAGFPYGDTEAAFARGSPHRHDDGISRLSFTPIECCVVVAEHNQPRAATMRWQTSRARSACIR